MRNLDVLKVLYLTQFQVILLAEIYGFSKKPKKKNPITEISWVALIALIAEL